MPENKENRENIEKTEPKSRGLSSLWKRKHSSKESLRGDAFKQILENKAADAREFDSAKKGDVSEKTQAPEIEEKDYVPILRTYENDMKTLLKEKGSEGIKQELFKQRIEREKEEQKLQNEARDLTRKSLDLLGKVRKEKYTQQQNKIDKTIVAATEKLPITSSKLPKRESLAEIVLPSAAKAPTIGKAEENINTSQITDRQAGIIKKEKLKGVWGEYKDAKVKLEETGLRKNDLRKFRADALPNRPRKSSIVFILIFLLILTSFGIIIYSVIINSNEQMRQTNSALNQTTLLSSTNDVLTVNNEISIDVNDTPQQWYETINKVGSANQLTKYIPFVYPDGTNVQEDLLSLFNKFEVNVPGTFVSSLDEYYFLGKHTGVTRENHILILSVKNFPNALVGQLAWSNGIINSFSRMYPDLLELASVNNTTVEKVTIDNKDITITTNNVSQVPINAYFFNKNLLVIIFGDRDVIPEINRRIRSTTSNYNRGI